MKLWRPCCPVDVHVVTWPKMENENLQLEVQALIYSAEKARLEAVAARLKVEFEGLSGLESLEKELVKVEASVNVALLQELKLLLSGSSFPR